MRAYTGIRVYVVTVDGQLPPREIVPPNNMKNFAEDFLTWN
jgi:hypothetical protein